MISDRTRRLIDNERLLPPERAGTIPSVRRSAGIRIAYCKNAAGTGSTIDCYLDTDGTGTEVTVTCLLSRTSNLNAAFPLLQDGDAINIWNNAVTWTSLQTFIGSEACS